MYNLTLKEDIESAIYEVRGVQVMLVSDVAKFYEVETKRINEVIKRNIDRFPKDFYFQLEKEEAKKKEIFGEDGVEVDQLDVESLALDSDEE